jgi:uncharacterized membrane protein
MSGGNGLRLQRTAAILALLGIPLAAYLTWVHYDTGALVCGLGDCHTVQQSEFATIGPLPVALLGLAMYATIVACNALALVRPAFTTVATSIAFAVALSGAIYALYLTWLEVTVIGAICQWCVASAVLTLLLAIIAGVAVWQGFGGSSRGVAETDEPANASLPADADRRGTAGGGPLTASRGRIST